MRPNTRAWLAAASLIAAAALPALGSTPEVRLRQLPNVPLTTRSVVITGSSAVRVWMWPSNRSRFRGLVEPGVRLPYMGIALGEGCRGPFYRVDAEGYVCSENATLSNDTAEAPQFPIVAERALLPWEYGFAKDDGVRMYRDYRRLGSEQFDRELLKGYALALKERRTFNGRAYYETLSKMFVAASDLNPAKASDFRGTRIESPEKLPAWAVGTETRVLSTPGGGRSAVTGTIPRLQPVEVLEERTVRGANWYRVGENQWVAAIQIRWMRLSSPPEGIGENDKWIDVDVPQQIVSAYEGRRPVYATLSSTGRDPNVTLPGIFHVYAKLAATTMDNADDTRADEFYSVEDVPWTMFFEQSYALHGAYWHNGFGFSRSHGCVNLAPLDSRWFFEWAEPRLPRGWLVVFSTRRNPGTMVRVRQPENQIPEPILKMLAERHRRREVIEDPPRRFPIVPLAQ